MSLNKKINIWELGSNINVRVNTKFMEFINSRIKEDFKTKRAIHKELIKYYQLPFTTFKVRMKKGYSHFLDLEILTNLCNILKISLEELQNNILAYKIRGGYNHIENPKLPIEITPLFEMLIAHNIGDGCVINCKGNRKKYFGYRQFDDEFRELYLKKCESLFGKIVFKKDYIKTTTRIYSPVAVSNLFFSYYNLDAESFLSEKARIPQKLFEKNNEYLLAFLLGMIIDEGHIDSTTIVIGVKNRNLAKDMKKLCDMMEYASKYVDVTKNDGGEYGYIYILKKGMVSLWQDYSKLIEKYPEASLGWKGERIKENFLIHNRKIQRKPGNNKIILDLISKTDYTVNEIAKEILMTRQGVRYHIHKLEKEGKIIKIGVKGENNYIYTISKAL